MSRSPPSIQPGQQLEDYRAGWSAAMRMLREGRSWSGNERNCVFLNCRSGPFANVSAVSGLDFADDGRALVTLDWDHDGDLDVWLYNRTGPRLRLMRNQAKNESGGNQFVALKLRGVHCNRDAIGARVTVLLKSAKERPLIQTLRAGEGFLSQSSKWLHFGLGESPQIEQVTVSWPGGETESFAGIELGRRYTLTQGAGKAAVWTPPERTVALKPTPLKTPMPTQIARIFMPVRVPMPTLEYDDLDGSPRRVASGGSRPTLINFWASWCQPCLAELKDLEVRKDDLRQGGLRVVALSVDGLGDGQNTKPADAAATLKRLGFTWNAGIARPETLEKIEILNDFLFERMPTFAVPTSLLLDGQGRLAAIYRGPVEIETLLTDVANLDASGERLRQLAQRFPGRWLRGTAQLDTLLVADKYRQRFPADYQILMQQALDQQRAARRRGDLSEDVQRQLDEKQALTHVTLANGLRDEGKFLEAAEHFRRAVELRPRHAQAHNDLGNVLTALRQFDAAEQHFRQAIEIRNDFADAYYNLGVAQVMQRKMSEAIVSWRKTIELKPDHSQAHANLGNAMAAQQQPEAAIRHFRRAIEIMPKNAKAHYNLANVLARTDQIDVALNHYRQAINAKPDYAKAHFALYQALQRSGDVRQAVAHLRAAVKHSPDDLPMKLSLVRVLSSHPDAHVRDGDEAVQLANEFSSASGGKNPLVLDALAAAQAESGEFDQAQTTQGQAVRLIEAAIRSAPNESARKKYRQFEQELLSRRKLYENRQPYRMPLSDTKPK